VVKQACGEEASGCSGVFLWHKRFEQQKDSLEDDWHTGRPRTIRTELKAQQVATLMHANLSQTVDEVTAAARIVHGTCHRILYDDLNTFHVIVHSVSYVLSQDQHGNRTRVCSDLTDSLLVTINAVPSSLILSTLKMEVKHSSETSVGHNIVIVMKRKLATNFCAHLGLPCLTFHSLFTVLSYTQTHK
jgi:hypothetical protein